MITFVNAKFNIGLFITSRRPDGYHDLETLFYPAGLYNGTPENPTPFCDILEITPSGGDRDRLLLAGLKVDCPQEKNLVWKAAELFRSELMKKREDTRDFFDIRLEKHLPDGAGLGGGSADASFTLRMLNELNGTPFSDEELSALALRLGADCPFFILNSPAFAGGVGERLERSSLDLSGWWAVVVKPELSISTREAFAGVTPRKAPTDLRRIAEIPVEEWAAAGVANDFEQSLFPLYPELRRLKEALIDEGASFASMSGSGAALFGLFPTREKAQDAFERLLSTEKYVWLLKL